MCSDCCASEGCLLMAMVRFLGLQGYKIPNYKGCLFFDSTLSSSGKHKSFHTGNTAKSLERFIGRERAVQILRVRMSDVPHCSVKQFVFVGSE